MLVFKGTEEPTGVAKRVVNSLIALIYLHRANHFEHQSIGLHTVL